MFDVLRMKISKRSTLQLIATHTHAIHHINPFNTSRSGVDTYKFFFLFCWQALVFYSRICCQIKFMSLINKQCQRARIFSKKSNLSCMRTPVRREWFFFFIVYLFILFIAQASLWYFNVLCASFS